ncbi:lycopene cyclase family protein [Oceanicaulis sp. LC35]|uniref:lycopene cyclase family protein n=1 Tax=Oceanicaulis sp. LC35 TaxID=3349635 RepID=UPI003F8247D1
MSERFDLVIIGAGLSGLALGAAMAQASRRMRTLIVEPRQIAPNLRQWVFPTVPTHVLRRFEAGRLSGFEVESLNGAVLHRPLDQLVLARVPAQSVQDAALDRIASEPRMALETGVRIDQIHRSRARVVLDTSLGSVRASWLVDTRPLEDVGMPAGRGVQLSHLVSTRLEDGSIERVRIKLASADAPLLEQWILSRDHAVQEQASFTLAPPRVPEALLQTDRLSDWGVPTDALRHAHGVWPLAYRPVKRGGGRVILAPADAYGLRFAPGMAALRLHRWAQTQARRLSYGLSLYAPPPPPHPARLSAARIEAMIARSRRQAAEGLHTLLYDAPADGVMRTLSGAASWSDLMRAWRSGSW